MSLNKEGVYRNVLFSGAATLIAELATLPICTIKTNYQNTSSNSILETIGVIYKRHGIRTFFAASLPAIGAQMLSTASKFTIYEYLKENRFLELKDHAMLSSMKNGAISGVISSLMTHPLDVIRVAWQMDVKITPQLRQLGPMLFYRGYSKTLSKVLVASSLFFPIYDRCKKEINSPILASCISAVISTSMMQPIDYMKTRHLSGLNPWNGFKVFNYYKGLSLNLIRIVPHFTITMTMIELLKSLFEE